MIAMSQGPVRRFVVALGISMGAGPAALPAQIADGLPLGALVAGDEASDASDVSTVRSAAPRPSGFLERQLSYPRVRSAYARKADAVEALLGARGVDEVAEVFFRVFKRERALEVWARAVGQDTFTLVKAYPVCDISGSLGPKRREGDLQVPEGFYAIDVFNPRSRYHLSMRVNYPNPVDQARGPGPSLGGDIYIHGGCATVGCVPVTDDKIEELYLIGARAREAGQRRIPVHIFPTRLDESGLGWLRQLYGVRFVDYAFWQNLQEGYLAFERTRRVPDIRYDGTRYAVRVAPAPLGTPVRRGSARPAGTGVGTDFDLDLTLWPLLPSVRLDAKTIQP